MCPMNLPLANLMFAPENWLLIAGIALLLFGKRLPDVGRSLGKGIVEFKKGLAGIEDEIEQSVHRPSPPPMQARLPDTQTATPGHKFDAYTGKPLAAPEPPPMRFDPYTGKPLSTEAAVSSQSGSNL